MIYKAAAALPHDNREQALDGLRGQLRLMTAAAGATPDWSSLTVTGPFEAGDVRDGALFEWTASIDVHGATVFDLFPDPDLLPAADTADDGTVPIPVSRF